MNILICEDDPGVVGILKKYLEIMNINADHVFNGKDAVTMLEKKGYDVVFVDINMPEMPGTEVLRYIERLDSRPRVAVLTGYPEEISDLSEKYEIDEYLQKPVLLAHIADIIKSVEREKDGSHEKS